MRLFAAVEVPQEQLGAVAKAIQPLKDRLRGARWTDPAGWHVTVKFFGEVPDEQVDELVAGLDEVARATAAVETHLMELGAFPTRRRARVLWVGLHDPEGKLDELAQQICRVTGFAAEKRGYHAHLTLARFRVPISVEGDLTEESLELDRSPFTIGRLTLFRSRLSPKGSRYEVVRRFEFSPTLPL